MNRAARAVSLVVTLTGVAVFCAGVFLLSGLAATLLTLGVVLVLVGLFAIPVPSSRPPAPRPDGPFHGVV